MTDKLRVIIAFRAVASLGNQGRLPVYKYEDREIAILDFAVYADTTERFALIVLLILVLLGLRFNRTMSRKESTVGGAPAESIGSPVRGQDNQESEGMSASLNSGAGTSVGVQSTSDRQTPVSGQEQSCAKGGVSSHMRKRTTTVSLTTRQQELAQKPRKAKTQKSRDVKAS